MLANAPIYPVLAASDLARARSWYADKLALQPAMEMDGALIWGSRPARRVVIETALTDRPRTFWLVLEPHDASLCVDHPGFEVDLWVSTDLPSLHQIWLRRLSVGEAMRAGRLSVEGPIPLVRSFPGWFVPASRADVVEAAATA